MSDDEEHTSAVIVAIPAADDPVNEAGDEPSHVTLAYMGEAADIEPELLDAIRQVVAAAAAVTGPFTSAVSGTALLGPDNAGVLLLESPQLVGLRELIVQASPVKAAMDKVDQFPSWVPHLTVSYGGELPARPDGGVRFAGVGLWIAGEQEDSMLQGDEVVLAGGPGDYLFRVDEPEQELVDPRTLPTASSAASIPLVASAADLPTAVRYAREHIAARWYVARRAAALGEPGAVPAVWRAPVDGVLASAVDYSAVCALDGPPPAPWVHRAIAAAASALDIEQAPEVITAAFWNAWRHPRGRDGKFIELGASVDVTNPADPSAPPKRARVMDLTKDGVVLQYNEPGEGYGPDGKPRPPKGWPQVISPKDTTKSITLAGSSKARLDMAEEVDVLQQVVDRRNASRQQEIDADNAEMAMPPGLAQELGKIAADLQAARQDAIDKDNAEAHTMPDGMAEELAQIQAELEAAQQGRIERAAMDARQVMPPGLAEELAQIEATMKGAQRIKDVIAEMDAADAQERAEMDARQVMPDGLADELDRILAELKGTGGTTSGPDDVGPAMDESTVIPGPQATDPAMTPAEYEAAVKAFNADVVSTMRPERSAFNKPGNAPLTDAEYQEHYEFVDEVTAAALAAGLATDVALKDSNGRWDPETLTKVEALADDTFAKLTNGVPQGRKAMVLGGLPGAGKSTLLAKMAEAGTFDPKDWAVANPDDVKADILERGLFPVIEGTSPNEMASLIHEMSSEVSKMVQARMLDGGFNVIFDITMGGNPAKAKDGKIGAERTLDSLPGLGYTQIDGLFLDVDLDTSAASVRGRHRGGVDKARAGKDKVGGRFVPDAVVMSNAPSDPAYRSINAQNFERAQAVMTRSATYDATDRSGGGAKLLTVSAMGQQIANPQPDAMPGNFPPGSFEAAAPAAAL